MALNNDFTMFFTMFHDRKKVSRRPNPSVRGKFHDITIITMISPLGQKRGKSKKGKDKSRRVYIDGVGILSQISIYREKVIGTPAQRLFEISRYREIIVKSSRRQPLEVNHMTARPARQVKHPEAEGSAKVKDMANKIARYVRKHRGGVSFVELEKLFDESKTKGHFIIENPHNCIWWTGMSKDFVDAVGLCMDYEEILARPTEVLVYLIDGKQLAFPLAKRPPEGGYKKPHWLPVVFDPNPGRGKRKRP